MTIDDEGFDLDSLDLEDDYDRWWWVYLAGVLAAFVIGIAVGLAIS